MADPLRSSCLLVRAGPRICALPVEQVIETMRPLPVTPLPGLPVSVQGAAVIRGAAVPVVDVDALLGGTASDRARFVLVRCGARAAALAVDAVLGVAPVDGSAPRAIALLQAATAGAVEALGALDRELLLVLAAARVVPDGAWRAIGSGAERP